MDIQAVVVPGMGVAACQAGVDNTRANQMLVYEEIRKGTDPERILELLREQEERKDEPQMERRQFGIVDLQGRSAGFSGSRNSPASLHVAGQVGDDIFFQVQGNILFDDDVAEDAALAFTRGQRHPGGPGDGRPWRPPTGPAATSAAPARRNRNRPPPATARPPMSPYIAIAHRDDAAGQSHNDGDYHAYLSVTDEDIQPHENANPVITLRLRYDAWKNAGSRRTGMPPSVVPE